MLFHNSNPNRTVLIVISFCSLFVFRSALVNASFLRQTYNQPQQPCIANRQLRSFAQQQELTEDYVAPLANQDLQCGVANSPAADTRIVGGSETQPNEYPWTVFLNLYFWSGDRATCTGTLIGSRWILTAAHCTFGAVNVSVILGSHDTSIGDNEPHRQTFVVSARNIKTHPDYTFGEVEDDIALVELPQDITYSKFVLPACLPFSDEPDLVGEPVILVGWGNYSSTPDSGLSPQLRRVQTSVISSYGTNGQCQQEAGKGAFSGDKIICGDGSQGHRFCYGDDGGPMNHYNNLTGTYTVAGVAWVGDATVNCQSSGLPTLYARVRNYVDWIYNNTDIAPTPKPTTTTTTTTTTTEDPTVFSCRNKPDGVYANPFDDCSTIFYMCSNYIKSEMICPDAGTVFNPATCYCDYPYNVLACGV